MPRHPVLPQHGPVGLVLELLSEEERMERDLVGGDPDIATRLKQIDALKAQGLITETEYTEKRAAILAEL